QRRVTHHLERELHRLALGAAKARGRLTLGGGWRRRRGRVHAARRVALLERGRAGLGIHHFEDIAQRGALDRGARRRRLHRGLGERVAPAHLDAARASLKIALDADRDDVATAWVGEPGQHVLRCASLIARAPVEARVIDEVLELLARGEAPEKARVRLGALVDGVEDLAGVLDVEELPLVAVLGGDLFHDVAARLVRPGARLRLPVHQDAGGLALDGQRLEALELL